MAALHFMLYDNVLLKPARTGVDVKQLPASAVY